MGVKSTALLFGDSTKEWISGFGIACIGGLALSGFNADLGICFICFWFLTPAVCFLLKVFLAESNLFALSPLSSLIKYRAGWPFYAFLAAGSGQLAWQIWTVNLSCPADCSRKYVLALSS